ncbi:unnamed protein product, partial [Rotaria socialis]
WTDYNEWSTCSVTCGEGFQFRKRDCVTVNDTNQNISSEKCIGKDTEIQPCTVTSCPGK